MAKVSFQRTDGSTVSFMAKKSSGAKRKAKGSKASSTKRKSTKRKASKSCGCKGTAKTGELAALKRRVTTVENDLVGVTEGVVGVSMRLGSAVNALTRRVDAHDQAIASLAGRARGMFASPGTPAAVPPSSRGAGGIEPGRMPPRPPQAPPRIAPGAAVPNRQMTLGLN